MSLILETRLSKQEIFTLYANQIYLGQQAGVSIYGVGEASNSYFGKDVSQLTLPEAAFIAGIIRSPNRYNPYKNPDRVKERRNQVLESMNQAGIGGWNRGEASGRSCTVYSSCWVRRVRRYLARKSLYCLNVRRSDR